VFTRVRLSDSIVAVSRKWWSTTACRTIIESAVAGVPKYAPLLRILGWQCARLLVLRVMGWQYRSLEISKCDGQAKTSPRRGQNNVSPARKRWVELGIIASPVGATQIPCRCRPRGPQNARILVLRVLGWKVSAQLRVLERGALKDLGPLWCAFAGVSMLNLKKILFLISDETLIRFRCFQHIVRRANAATGQIHRV
jgi:hypothetical protein